LCVAYYVGDRGVPSHLLGEGFASVKAPVELFHEALYFVLTTTTSFTQQNRNGAILAATRHDH